MTMLVMLLSLALQAGSRADTLYAVDLYGLRAVSGTSVRAAIGLRAGDPVPASLEPIRSRLAALPGVAETDVSTVCCSPTGRTILYVGIRETGTPALRYRDAPHGSERLPADVLAAGDRLQTALVSAVQRGVMEEDVSRGYSLAKDSALRSVQEEYIQLAARHFDLLTKVLRNSSDTPQRALAAQVIAYAPERQKVVQELLHAVADPGDEVRNNATRALAVLAQWANSNTAATISIPAAPFVPLLNSVSWTDRNKAVFLLMPLSASRDTALFEELRAHALTSLVEMARWSNDGHALGPFIILARMAGLDDGEAFQAWQRGERESVITRAMGQAPKSKPAATVPDRRTVPHR